MPFPRGDQTLRWCTDDFLPDQVSLELGGKSPHLIFESANLDQAANWACLGILYNTGQDCTAGSRLYVQETIYDKFVALLVEKAAQLVIGDGFDEKSGGGPVVSSFVTSCEWQCTLNFTPGVKSAVR